MKKIVKGLMLGSIWLFFLNSGLFAGEGLPGEYASNYVMTARDANANYLNPAQLLMIDRPEFSLFNTFLSKVRT